MIRRREVASGWYKTKPERSWTKADPVIMEFQDIFVNT